jgi:glycosyltransferase involved in cell wall biosynthesis
VRIAYVSSSQLPSRYANSIHVMKMCQALADVGHDVLLTATPGGEHAESDYEFYGVRPCFDIAKHCVPRFPPGYRGWRYAWKVAGAIKRWGPVDLICGRYLPGIAVAALRGTPCIVELHQPPVRSTRRIINWLSRRGCLHKIVVITEALRNACVEALVGVPPDRFIVCPDAADEPSIDECPDVLLPFAKTSRLQIGYTGHLYPGKGMEILTRLAARLPSCDFHVVGGMPGDVASWQTVSVDIRNIHFHSFVAPALVPAYQQSMDILLAPYQEQVLVSGGKDDVAPWMSPLKIFEYMSVGKPIIASDLPVLREVLTDGENALLAPSSDVAKWEAQVNRLRDPSLRNRLGSNALREFRSQFTWQSRARRVLGMVDERKAA